MFNATNTIKLSVSEPVVHFVGLNLEDGKTYDVNILNAPTHAWERLA